MSLSIAITTAPRPRETFTASLESLRAAGFEQTVYVLADCPTQPAGNCEVIRNEPKLGGLKNWCQALETLLQRTDADWLMVLEDDVTWASGAAQALERDLAVLSERQDIGYLSLYLPRWNARRMEHRAKGRLTPGFHVYDADNSWGSQAYVISRPVAERLLAKGGKFDNYRRNYTPNKNRDTLVSRCLQKMGLKLLHRVPCLVDHKLGSGNSSLSRKPVLPNLRTDYFTGSP